MPTVKRSSLGREITVLLIAKLILIVAINLAFFSHPLKPGSEGTAKHLLPSFQSILGDATHE